MPSSNEVSESGTASNPSPVSGAEEAAEAESSSGVVPEQCGVTKVARSNAPT